MLVLDILDEERFDEEKQEFVYGKACQIQLEHSLLSLAKWESKWQVPFLSKKEMTEEQVIDYIKCMTITKNVPDEVYRNLGSENYAKVTSYIEAPMTATWFRDSEEKGKINNEQVTAELIYYWMIALQIPFECQKWHLNRLITLIRVCIIKNQPPKKMSQRELANRNRALNEARKKALGTKG